MMWDGDGSVAWWGWLLMSVGMVAFWGLIIWAVWALMTNFARRPGSETPSRGPKEILDDRLARGEIDPEEYQRMRDRIRGRGVPTDNRKAPAGVGDRR